MVTKEGVGSYPSLTNWDALNGLTSADVAVTKEEAKKRRGHFPIFNYREERGTEVGTRREKDSDGVNFCPKESLWRT